MCTAFKALFKNHFYFYLHYTFVLNMYIFNPADIRLLVGHVLIAVETTKTNKNIFDKFLSISSESTRYKKF